MLRHMLLNVAIVLFKKACKLLNMEDETIEKLADLIDRKSMVDLKLFLDTLNLEPNQNNL